jgi:DNA repair exonuclease SbcCD ATPase subunit
MNLKTLRKKIRKLETRLQEGPQKLAKLKRKLEAMTKAKATKAKLKAAAQVAAARQTTKTVTPIQKERRASTGPPQTKAAVAQKQRSAKKVKRKLNLSPERRAQLAAAMKARWAAKKAAANSQGTGTEQDATQ